MSLSSSSVDSTASGKITPRQLYHLCISPQLKWCRQLSIKRRLYAGSHVLDEAERSLHDALCVLSQTVADSRVLYGGGYPEMQMAKASTRPAGYTMHVHENTVADSLRPENTTFAHVICCAGLPRQPQHYALHVVGVGN